MHQAKERPGGMAHAVRAGAFSHIYKLTEKVAANDVTHFVFSENLLLLF